ncbi:hypothetical protein ACQP2Y_12400 [Actinoplanes sp. CA-051413]|uniref:hypothetical protein n=1 Tax=Actinoplanes sp. CA-051413 TaxID=3239899 RepID=UPI003D9A04B7
MNDFVSRLLSRGDGPPLIRPLLPSVFEPGPALADHPVPPGESAEREPGASSLPSYAGSAQPPVHDRADRTQPSTRTPVEITVPEAPALEPARPDPGHRADDEHDVEGPADHGCEPVRSGPPSPARLVAATPEQPPRPTPPPALEQPSKRSPVPGPPYRTGRARAQRHGFAQPSTLRAAIALTTPVPPDDPPPSPASHPVQPWAAEPPTPLAVRDLPRGPAPRRGNPPAERTVTVTIGRVELRATPERAPAPKRREPRRPPAPSLQQYLRDRSGGDRT